MRFWGIVVLSLAAIASSAAQATSADGMRSEIKQFRVGENLLSGLFSRPANDSAEALVIIVHGYGKTNVIDQDWYYKLRAHLAGIGIASFVWDKPGSGRSEGQFDADQPVASSADEVVLAAEFLRSIDAPGSGQMGLWGISRAGWIAPLALSRDEDLTFWISVSGVDDKESFGYLLESNWRIAGYPEQRISHLLMQWTNGNRAVAEGKDYSEVLELTRDYRADPFVLGVVGGEEAFSEAAFDKQQKTWRRLAPAVDPSTGLMIYVDNFEGLLSSLNVPVLALFGEKDSIVDWQSAKSLYEQAIGQNPNASLSIKTFPDGNHNLHQCKTGGFDEMIEILRNPRPVDGYYDTILTWLEKHVLER